MNKRTIYGELRGIPGDAQESRIIPFVLSTYAKDRHGTVLNQDGWILEPYKRNPIVAFQHSTGGGSSFLEPNPDLIIGKSVNIYFEGSGRHRRLVADCKFEPAEINPLAEKVFQKCLFGSLRSASVGFIPLGEGHYGSGDEARGGSNEVYYFAGQELLEWSIVSIPSNSQATKKSLSEADQGARNYAFNNLNRFSQEALKGLTQEEILVLLDSQNYQQFEKYDSPYRIINLMREWRARQKQLMDENPGRYFQDLNGRFRRTDGTLIA